MRWKKTNGQTMEAQDNEATEKYLLSLGFEKIGSPPVEIGDPETDADGQDNPPVEPETHEISEAEMPSQGNEQSIAPDDVGKMPKSILG